VGVDDRDESGYSHAYAGREPAVLGIGEREGVAPEGEIGVDSGTDDAGGAGDREGRSMSRSKHGSGSDERGKHGGQGRVWDFLIFCSDGDEARSGGVDTGSKEWRTTHGGVLCGEGQGFG
jgi:hypothetical protein